MDILILKLGATGDVVRTTPLLRRFDGHVTWVTASKNVALLQRLNGLRAEVRVLDWENRALLDGASFDLVVNLEDDVETAAILKSVRFDRLFGAYANGNGRMAY